MNTFYLKNNLTEVKVYLYIYCNALRFMYKFIYFSIYPVGLSVANCSSHSSDFDFPYHKAIKKTPKNQNYHHFVGYTSNLFCVRTTHIFQKVDINITCDSYTCQTREVFLIHSKMKTKKWETYQFRDNIRIAFVLSNHIWSLLRVYLVPHFHKMYQF
jgi:hypothetical protein